LKPREKKTALERALQEHIRVFELD
jgi:hypothetical protein